MATIRITLKLLVDKKANKVLFAEATKDFVDFLFSLLSLPLGSAVSILTDTHVEGSIGNVYRSVKEMSDTYIDNKDMLLNPTVVMSAVDNPFLITQKLTPSKTYYICGSTKKKTKLNRMQAGRGSFHNYTTTNPNTLCPSCNLSMSTEITDITFDADEGESFSEGVGYMKGLVTYLVTDDLAVMPMSNISSIAVLKKFNVENLSLVEEKDVDFGMEQGIELLKASLWSKTALSDVFLGSK